MPDFRIIAIAAMRVRGAAGGVVLSILAVLCLTAHAAAQANEETKTLRPTIVFFFDDAASASIWPAVQSAFLNETAEEQVSYPLPSNLELVSAASLKPGSEFGRTIQVHLLGRCDVAEQAYRPLPPGPLGWVYDVSGEIQPFVYADCNRLAQFLNAKLLGMSDEQRNDAMARAIARIAMHEWLHITLQAATHSERGIRRAELTADDLVRPYHVAGD